VLSREQLIDSVWGDSVYIEDRSVDRHISSIRKKLGSCSSYIRTVPGLGYQFLAEQQH
ncbi:MAG: winged helix family transcriptional regulator, partial [Proteobacteria bacterium]